MKESAKQIMSALEQKRDVCLNALGALVDLETQELSRDDRAEISHFRILHHTRLRCVEVTLQLMHELFGSEVTA